MNKMNKFLKSILKTGIYLLDQSDRVAADMRERVADRVDEVSDRVSDLRDRARDLYGHEDHTLRNLMTFAAGVGVGIGAGMLLAPTSGEDMRNSIGDKVHDIGDRVRTRFSSEANRATGTKGV
jgi:gas vesicle protein